MSSRPSTHTRQQTDIAVAACSRRSVKVRHTAISSHLAADDLCSGKSSVLEGLTDLPFPRDSGLCTRFATHITFRRNASTRVSVSILPTANAHPDHAEKLKKYQRNLENLDQSTFAEILGQVSQIRPLQR